MSSTVYLLRPITQKGKSWIKKNVQYEPYQSFGGGVVIEHRYIEDIIEGMEEANLIRGIDFEITS